MSNLEFGNLLATITSFVLSIVAIWMALYFYHKSKEAEKNTAITLNEIKNHAGMLERLTGRWMDRFTKYAVNPKPADETTTLLMSIVERSIIPTSTGLKQIDETDPPENLIIELITCYILIHYYSALTNISTQGYLPDEISQIDNSLKIKELVDSSSTTFFHLDKVLEKVDQIKLQNNASYTTYCETISDYKPLIKDTTSYYAAKSIDSSC
ncbi:MAG: hypothetical protein UT05_C0015G0005 [Parcubacteria group bacterium GW2011_GWF2_38_76]|nr:MAG: hypothetical protein UT05_C0015G0005 [Parcubacteria group bacterium GW2011_GWF2_38_76]